MTWRCTHKLTAPHGSSFRVTFFHIGIVVTCLLFGICPSSVGEEGPPKVLIVRGTVSTPNEGERAYAERVTARLSGWLHEIGIRHEVLDDEAVTVPERTSAARVLILSYNPNLPQAELRALQGFVERGGKLIVFYSCDLGLASLMRVKMGRYMKEGRGRQWHSFTFIKGGPEHLPRTIFQHSRNIRPIYPAGKDSKVIAYWADASGKPLADPAWVQSPHGFWMTHVLQDGSIADKTSLLLGLIGACEPSVWRAAAERSVAACGRTKPFKDFADAVERIGAQARGKAREKDIAGLLLRARTGKDGLGELLERKRFQEAVSRARGVDGLITRAYALAQESRAGEFRGVWDHSGTGPYPGDWARTCKLLSDSGMNAVFPNFIRNGVAHYKSRVLARSDIFSQYGDQVQKCLNAARKSGIQVHAWKICWRMDSAPRPFLARMREEGRLQQEADGTIVNWLCPSDRRNLDFELAAVKELARYRVHGIHLDYNRYRDGRSCYCAGCRERFEKKLRRKVGSWPADVRKAPLGKEYQAWRCEQTDALVMNAARIVREADDKIRLSAAVFGGYPKCVAGVGQDWARWLKDGYVDFVCPMNYTVQAEKFGTLLKNQISLPNAAGRVIPGIGVTATESKLTPAQTIEQILISRENGVPGYVLFQLGVSVHREILPAMKLGVTARK